MSQPITPDEALEALNDRIPDVVYDAFNALIQEKLRPGSRPSAVIRLDQIIERILELDNSMTATMIYEQNMLDVEDIYRNAGWKVTYDQPGYNEHYDATFRFEAPRER